VMEPPYVRSDSRPFEWPSNDVYRPCLFQRVPVDLVAYLTR
jgi:hypothetical protein